MIDVYVEDIRVSLQNRCYFAALALTLTLPDICGAAEYSGETAVAKRYIGWYDKYLGDYMAASGKEPFLSGEIVYSLRNMFLHSGEATVNAGKIKEEANQLDRFQLVLGDGKDLWSMTMLVASPIVNYRAIQVEVTYLCQTICDCALWYYQNNKEKFSFNFSVITQEELFSEDKKPPEFSETMVKLLNQKLKSEPADVIAEKCNRFMKAQAKKEAQVRSFFGQHFKEPEYRQKKEQIIQAVLQSTTKNQVNMALQKVFSNEKTSIIYKRFAPFIASWPGQ